MNFSVFYIAMFWKVYQLAKVPDSPQTGSVHPVLMTETMNRIEEYHWWKKLLITVDTMLMVLAGSLAIFITEAARNKHGGMMSGTVAHTLRLFVVWAVFICQNFIKETLSDTFE